ncbi:hypothetical protein DVK44_33775 [Streptomyces paludis]|uniref:Uncharacterized protein n=1 Tax=Streptomyces paludis TaxID=2282738 RepID=A0A345I2A6_9ACTN|nr:hypothetical protein DVK44_33775 [Streptomyces paludis]
MTGYLYQCELALLEIARRSWDDITVEVRMEVLDEVRRYVSWYRHITLAAMLARAFLAATAHRVREKEAEPVRLPGPSSSPWRRFGDPGSLSAPNPRTGADVEADITR